MEKSGFDLTPPNKELAISVLTQSVGEEVANILWEDACQACGCSVDPTTQEELMKVFDELGTHSGRVGVHGVSLKLRLKIYHQLHQRYFQNAS